MLALRTAEPDDGTLLELVRSGDRNAFGTLMRRYNQRVFRIARAILVDDAEAEDAGQEAWVSAYRHLHQFEGRSSFSSWIGRIVSREALARARRRRPVPVAEVSEEVMDRRDDPERRASQVEARAILERAIDSLPDSFRTVFVLRAVEEMSVAETAACLEIPEDTVKTRLHRARRLLRDDLAQQLDIATTDAFAFAGARCDRMVEQVLRRLEEEPAPP
jgi:RNA polymerase sigma-70 factor (ECF subfamily)